MSYINFDNLYKNPYESMDDMAYSVFDESLKSAFHQAVDKLDVSTNKEGTKFKRLIQYYELDRARRPIMEKIGELMKKNEDLSRENNKLESKKNELIQQVNNLNDLVDLNNKDLVNKILELQKVIEVLNKELDLENDKKFVLENKIMNLEKSINKQIDEVSEREEMSIRKTQKEPMENNSETKAFNIKEEQDNKIESYKIQILSLKNENYSLMKTINNLKNEIRIYKIKLNSSKKVKEGKDKNNIKDDEDLTKNITEEMNRWKKGYYNLSKLNDIYKEKLSKLENGKGMEEEIKYLKEALYQKDKLLMDLTLQIKEYQSESDDIILGKSNKKLEKQIGILLNEVKGLRKRLLNLVTFNDTINNFEEFINNIEIIQKLENQIKNKEAKKACEKLKLFIDEYKINNEMAFNEFLVKLYSI
jgi:chromosome segregation ATPase